MKRGKVWCDGNYVCWIEKRNWWYGEEIVKSVKEMLVVGD